MNALDTVSSSPSQRIAVVLEDGAELLLTLVYRAATQRWSIDVDYSGLAVQGINLCTHPNILREWRRIIPFGIGCVTADGSDPVYQDDFENGRATLVLLTAAEVAQIEATFLGAGT